MRTLVLLGWLMVPVIFGAYHYGPGPERLRLDDAARVLAEADRLAAAEQWQSAVTKYDEAQALLPEGRVDDVRRIRLRVRAQGSGDTIGSGDTT
jgi:precorrin-3B methylase